MEGKVEPDLTEVRRGTGHSGNTPGQGPFMKVSILVVKGLIHEATFETYQCPGCVACGKAICDLARKKSLAEAASIRHENLVQVVGPLPKHRQICYGLALLALGSALKSLPKEETYGPVLPN